MCSYIFLSSHFIITMTHRIPPIISRKPKMRKKLAIRQCISAIISLPTSLRFLEATVVKVKSWSKVTVTSNMFFISSVNSRNSGIGSGSYFVRNLYVLSLPLTIHDGGQHSIVKEDYHNTDHIDHFDGVTKRGKYVCSMTKTLEQSQFFSMEVREKE